MANPAKVIKNLLGAEEAIGEFIAGPDRDGLPGAVQDGYRHRCREFANLPPWARALSGVAGGSIGRICEPYLDGNMWDGPELAPPPFEGGQCPGVAYLVTFQLRRFIGGEWIYTNPNQTVATGPVSIGKASPDDVGGCEAQGLFVGNAAVLNGNGTVARVLANNCVDILPGYIIGAVTRADGQPDTCGSLPPTLVPGPNPPPDPGPLPGPEPTDNPDPDNPIPIIPIPPYDDPVFGPVPITGPDDDFGGGGGGGGGGFDYGPIGSPGTPQPSSGDDNASGEAPDGFELTGLKVDFQVIPPKANQFKEGVYRGVCYAYLGTVEGLDLDPAGATMRSGQFIFAERPRLTRWEVSANSGWSILVTPYYRPIEETP